MPPVAMVAITLPVALAATDSLNGLKVQEEFAGSVPQLKVNVPAEPLIVAMPSVKLAAWPLEIVLLAEPFSCSEKSNPVPERGT